MFRASSAQPVAVLSGTGRVDYTHRRHAGAARHVLSVAARDRVRRNVKRRAGTLPQGSGQSANKRKQCAAKSSPYEVARIWMKSDEYQSSNVPANAFRCPEGIFGAQMMTVAPPCP